MAKGLVSWEYLHDIAEAIRKKYGISEGTDTEVVLSMFSARVIQVDENTATIEIEDADGVTRATIRGVRGEKGEPGDVSFDELTPEQIEMLRGPKGDKGDKGDSYEITDEDMQEIESSVLGVAIPSSEKGSAGGVATLDQSGKVPSAQLPSYVDDVLEYPTQSSFPSSGEAGKIYVDVSTNSTFRWSGSSYISIGNPLDIATEAEAVAGTDNTKVMTPLRVKQAMADLDRRVTTIEENDLSGVGF